MGGSSGGWFGEQLKRFDDNVIHDKAVLTVINPLAGQAAVAKEQTYDKAVKEPREAAKDAALQEVRLAEQEAAEQQAAIRQAETDAANAKKKVVKTRKDEIGGLSQTTYTTALGLADGGNIRKKTLLGG